MAFNLPEFKIFINLLTAAQRKLLKPGVVDTDLMVIEVLPYSGNWYRLVTKGTLVVGNIAYGVGLHKMDPTEGGTYTYNSMGEDLSYIDIHPGIDNVLKSVKSFTENRDVTAEALPEEPVEEPIDGTKVEPVTASTIVLVHHYAEIIGEDGDNMKPMFVLESGKTIHVDTLGGQIVAAFEFEQ